MKSLKIDREKLNEVVTEAVKDMVNFDWSGWKIDILISDESEIWSSAKNTNNVYPNSNLLFSVEAWNFDEEESEYADENDAVYFTTNQYIEWFESGQIGYLNELQDKFEVDF